MAVAAVLSVLCAVIIAMGAVKLGHYAARNREMPDAGPVQEPAVEWPRMREGETGEETWPTAHGLGQPAATAPAQTPPKAVDDARDAVNRLLAERRVRVADSQGGLSRGAAWRS